MLPLLILHTILCLAGFVLSFGILMGIGYAVERKPGSLPTVLTILGLLFHATPLISLVLSWLFYLLDLPLLTTLSIALPYLNLLLIIALYTLINRRP